MIADGRTDGTAALQAALDRGLSEIHFDDGIYLLGTVRVPADTRLIFSSQSSVRVNTAAVQTISPFISDRAKKCLLIVTGDHVTIDGMTIDFTIPGSTDDLLPNDAIDAFVYARGVRDLLVTRARAEKPERREMIPLQDRKREGRYKGRLGHMILLAEDCDDVTLSDSRASSIDLMLYALMCRNVDVHGNRMTTGGAMTTFSVGSQYLRHHDNWSCDVGYQVVWRGGSPDPSRKAPEVPLGSSTIVHRGSRPDDPDYNRHTTGVYDIVVENNYAEYGKTLAWGNKCRQVLISNNIARYMADYAFGAEGGENILFTGNVSVNSTSGSFVSMYWGEKLSITGNTAIVRCDNWDPQLSWWPSEKQYQGGFVRLHHGPTTKEDTEAGSRYGAGQVFISGNQFVNELTGIPKDIGIQPGRDVTVTGNKFTNGSISKWGPGALTVTDNHFTWTFAQEFACVETRNSSGDVTILNNVMQRKPDTGNVASAEEVADLGPGPAASEKEAEEQPAAANAAAITVNWKSPLRLIANGNVIDGWTQSVHASCESQSPGTLLLMNNLVNGDIDVTGNWKQRWQGNVNLDTLLPLTGSPAGSSGSRSAHPPLP